MDYKILLDSRFIRFAATLAIGFIGSVAVNPEMALSFSGNAALSGNTLLMAQSASLAGSWRLVNISESATPTPMVPPQDTELTASFEGDRIFGSGGCNRFMGGYQTEGNQLTISPLASTRMACEESVMNQEIRYLMALEGAQRYEVNDQGELQIFYQTEQGAGILRFTSQTVRGLW
jgi:heat shock protein HslJ